MLREFSAENSRPTRLDARDNNPTRERGKRDAFFGVHYLTPKSKLNELVLVTSK